MSMRRDGVISWRIRSVQGGFRSRHYDGADLQMVLPRALVQMAAADQLHWRAELAEVVDGQAEGGSGAVRGSPLRPRSHHPVRALVPSLQAQSARLGGDDGRAQPVDGAYDHHALG